MNLFSLQIDESSSIIVYYKYRWKFIYIYNQKEEKVIEKLESDLLRDIGVLSRAINYISDVKYKEFNLQKGQFIFLTRICENPKINFVDLANMLKVDKTTAIKAVNKLISLGYVNKETDSMDKRASNLAPTEKALEVYNCIIREENKQINICLNKFNEDEKKLVKNLVKVMSKNIEEELSNIKNKGVKKW